MSQGHFGCSSGGGCRDLRLKAVFVCLFSFLIGNCDVSGGNLGAKHLFIYIYISRKGQKGIPKWQKRTPAPFVLLERGTCLRGTCLDPGQVWGSHECRSLKPMGNTRDLKYVFYGWAHVLDIIPGLHVRSCPLLLAASCY